MPLRLLCDAIPFCYGPAAALENLLDAILTASPVPLQVDVLATGSTRELLSRSMLPVRLVSVDSEDVNALRAVPFGSYDAFLNVCNPTSFQVAREASRIPIAYVDFLLWMHTGPAAGSFSADLYLAENYPGTAKWIAQRGHELPNLTVIAPLIKRASRQSTVNNSLLVGLGGLYSRLTVPGENSRYAPLMLEAIVETLPPGRFSAVIVAGPAGIAETARKILTTIPYARYVSLSHDEFLCALGEAEAFVSHPGLYAAFEAMLSGVPTAFLPPSNYTQVLQLRHYRSSGIANHSFTWDDTGLDFIPPGLPEEEGVRAVLRLVSEAETSPRALTGLRNTLASFFAHDASSLRAFAAAQQRLASQYGVDGPRRAAEQFLDWTASLALGMDRS